MDRDRLEELAEDPRFIPGIYNYCDRWCERCAFTSNCMNYALSEAEFDSPESRDIRNRAFWDKLSGIFMVTLEMLKEKAEEFGIDLDARDTDEIAGQAERIHETAREQPYSRAAMQYIRRVDEWFATNEGLLEEKGRELESFTHAEIPGISPDDDAIHIKDCLEVVRWYQHQVYVKLCRAVGGLLHGDLKDNEHVPKDADGSAKVAIIGIERSIAAWAALLSHFPDQERPIVNLLAALKRLLRQVEAAFPHARTFIRPGFDTTGRP